MAKPLVVSLIPNKRYHQVMTPEAESLLTSFAEYQKYDGAQMTEAEVAAALAPADGCLTSWGLRPFSAETIAQAKKLRIIGHAAGSVRKLVPPESYDQVVVLSASPLIAKSVGEMAFGMIIAARRQFVRHHNAFATQGTRGDTVLYPSGDYSHNHGLHHTKIGLIGASATGRYLLRFLKAYEDDIEILIYDPYLSAEDAEILGVRKAELDELLSSCDVVSLHAPLNEKTAGMIGRREVKLMKDGALLVNTARGGLIDHEALYEELATGRIYAALDVYLETLRDAQCAASPYRKLPNVLITPGMAGPTIEVSRTLGLHIIRDMQTFFSGGRPRYQVLREKLTYIA
ncbi:MAG TPA: hydroxyacid dehydrogenase [Firmicutes bacterium]|nr:hydroxyacid dehydrogenase [Bacillota bacterium]